MSKPLKIVIGFASILPNFYIVFFMAAVASEMILRKPIVSFGVLFLIHGLVILYLFALLAFFSVHVFKNQNLKGDYRVLWLIALFVGNMIVMPIYWYFYIWKEPDTSRGAVNQHPMD